MLFLLLVMYVNADCPLGQMVKQAACIPCPVYDVVDFGTWAGSCGHQSSLDGRQFLVFFDNQKVHQDAALEGKARQRIRDGGRQQTSPWRIRIVCCAANPIWRHLHYPSRRPPRYPSSSPLHYPSRGRPRYPSRRPPRYPSRSLLHYPSTPHACTKDPPSRARQSLRNCVLGDRAGFGSRMNFQPACCEC